MESCFVSVDSVPIHYWRAGTGPALLMIHGLVADGRNWELNVPALAPLRTVYAIDMINMGQSAGGANAEARLAPTADWLARLMDALGLAEADLVGSSHGGAVCLMFAGRHPFRVRSLALFAPANPYCRNAAIPVRFWNSAIGRVAARLIPILPAFASDLAHKRVYGDPGKARECTLAGYRAGLKWPSIAHLLRIVETWWADMSELELMLPTAAGVPTLLIWGERDAIVSPASGQRLGAELDARLVLISGAGHLPFVEAVEESNGALTKWLGEAK